uniref:ORF15 n=1 Tax=Nitrosopumilaceae spindle-shaped virus TaxID=3065433 RepID=A0AAT9J9C0_9VIRU
MYWYIILAILAVSFVSNEAYAQSTVTIIGDESLQPCFMNMTAGASMWDNCGADEDYLDFALMPFEYITGGYFSMIIVTIFVIMSYIKYHNVLYPVIIGLLFIPISYTFFPEVFLTYALILIAVAFGGLLTRMIIWRTRN